MDFYLLDIVYPREWEQRQARQKQIEKAKDQPEKQEKQIEKPSKKEERAKRKAEKKAERAKKKTEKKVQKHSKDLSVATPTTVETVQVPSNQAPEPAQAAMPTGVVLAVCASLLICLGSAWFYRRFNSIPDTSRP